MRRRTRKMSSRRPAVYLAIVAAGFLARLLYNASYAPAAHEARTEADVSVPVVGNAASGTAPAAVNVYRSGWAKLPSERADDDIYYTHHLFFGPQGAAAPAVRNYTACYSSRYRCPLWVAAPQHPSYRGGAKRSGNFRFDPTLPLEVQPQLSRSFGDYTRGHLLGSAERTATAEANRQTFYASNVAPQLQAGFNAASGAWNNLESFVDRQVCADTLYVVTGCMFADYTDGSGRMVEAAVTRNRNDGSVVAVPTAFYKVLLRTRAGDTGRGVGDCAPSELKCAAFVVGHCEAKGRKPSAADMMSVAELERLTGEVFFANVPSAPKGEAEAADWGL